jgi:hypothetical protein
VAVLVNPTNPIATGVTLKNCKRPRGPSAANECPERKHLSLDLKANPTTGVRRIRFCAVSPSASLVFALLPFELRTSDGCTQWVNRAHAPQPTKELPKLQLSSGVDAINQANASSASKNDVATKPNGNRPQFFVKFFAFCFCEISSAHITVQVNAIRKAALRIFLGLRRRSLP